MPAWEKTMAGESQTNGPDLKNGVSERDLPDGGMLVGHVDGDPVLLARRGKEIFAIGAICTHYGGPLGKGLMVDDTVRCPWHQACFSLRTGEALVPPALTPTACWRVERRDGRLFVREKIPPTERQAPTQPAVDVHGGMVIIGGGAAGFAATEMLRREGYDGRITLVSADDDPPYDRPNLSKDYLAGSASEDWIPLRPADFYAENDIDLRLGTTATAVDVADRRVTLTKGGELVYECLLIASGAEPIRLPIPGADLPHVRTLRSLADCREIIARARNGSRAVIVGASFIGLEGAAALRRRGVDVHVVAPERRLMEHSLGSTLGDFLRSLHESHGVTFHLGRRVAEIDERSVRLDDGSKIDADLVLVGIGVRPRLDLAEKAGLAIDRGVVVNQYLETSAPGIFAAGDIARWPDPHSGQQLRIEHWVVAERQGQTAARNMLGRQERYAAVPFFWTRHYDVSIDYVGHAAAWDRVEQSGDADARDVALRFRKDGHTLAVATIHRGLEMLKAERDMEKGRSP
jgi:NADPH-dependent 2,4-dienoyl-CoA reductase/sulfur reductase-like enzyme/nitrite reductase/ring-hydroxylating ferredoxin subunit